MKKTLMILTLLIEIIYTVYKRPNITIYIESQCIDTISFIEKSLKETLQYKRLNNIIDVRFVPFGNAQQFEDIKGFWQFECQHGEVECYGNQMHNCALDILNGFYNQAEYLVCIHSIKKTTKEEYDYDGRKCMSKHPCLFEKVTECMKSLEGNYLVHRSGIQTKAKDVFYVPWINVEDIHDHSNEFKIIDSLVEWACNQYNEKDKDEICLPQVE